MNAKVVASMHGVSADEARGPDVAVRVAHPLPALPGAIRVAFAMLATTPSPMRCTRAYRFSSPFSFAFTPRTHTLLLLRRWQLRFSPSL